MHQDTRRMQAVQSPIIPVVGELIRNHPGTISLGQGVVHYGPPPEIEQAIAQIMADPAMHKYQAVEGLPQLHDVITNKLAEFNGVSLGDDARLVVTAGGNMAFMNAMLAITDPGDEVIIQKPYYFNHEMAITIADCTPVPVDTDDAYQLDLAAIESAITSRTRAIVTVSPNNPTGAVYSRDALCAVNELCAKRGLYHISDEAYEYFTYDGAVHFSPSTLDADANHTISLFSLSKAFGFASWRVGYMVIPQRLFFSVKKIQDTILICPPVVTQAAAVGAMRVGLTYPREMLAGIVKVRRIVLDALSGLGGLCDIPRADGAFYFLLRLHTDHDPMALVEQLVKDHRVAVIPGTTFGMERGCYLRVAYGALDEDTALEGIERLTGGLHKILGR
ncbi:MAG: pyridoxal phosphate-dependent aminotransferase [Phycisphaeraceae bacterium]|nr:pyridoxal phosphate-dependent aminotransferase [Phycisphaeraceae bacterium]